jgi:hypothetical protein
MSFRLWNYNPSNDDQLGDDWNGENFSWFSRKRALPPSLLYYEQAAPSLDCGARILPAVVRPYPAKTAGIPLQFNYEMTTGEFNYTWANPSSSSNEKQDAGRATVSNPPRAGHLPLASRETEIFIPSMLTLGRNVIVRGLGPDDSYLHDESRQTLFVVTSDPTPNKSHKITVTVDPLPQPMFEVNDFWGDYGGNVVALAAIFLGIIAYMVLRLTV